MQSTRDKIKRISDKEEQRTILGLLDIIESEFGFGFTISQKGKVIEVQMVSAGLVSVPRGLTRLNEMYRLHLQSNKIRRLRNLDKCTAIQILDLSDNQISTPELSHVGKLSHLNSLDLSFNNIDSLNPLKSLEFLESLKITNNKITEIPKLPSLTNLKFLDLSNNPIKTLENIHLFEKLIQLKIDKNQLNTEEDEILKKGINEVKEYCRKKEK